MPGSSLTTISPSPTEDEAVAIAVAIEALWPRPMLFAHAERDRSMVWRMSGRWWQRDRFASVRRPWM